MFGFAPPCEAVKARLLGVTVNVEAALTVNVTGTVTVVAPVALRLMEPLYVAAVSEPVDAVTVMVPLPEPDDGLTANQLTLSLAVHVSVLPPALLIFNV